jgi:predicted ribosome quality control (RQC) complex YloA/Tae2 family protein
VNYDVVTMAAVAAEVKGLAGARVARVDQPLALSVLIGLFAGGGGAGGGARRLLLCAHAGLARVHFTAARYENPARPPAFCQLLRSRLDGARLVAVEQQPLERGLMLTFDAPISSGGGRFALHVEVMGRHSNIILVDADGRVVDAIKRVGVEKSRPRQVLPGLEYAPPPPRPPLLSLPATPEELAAALGRAATLQPTSRRAGMRQAGTPPGDAGAAGAGVMDLLQVALPWLGPVWTRETAARAGLGADAAGAADTADAAGTARPTLNAEDYRRLAAALDQLWSALAAGEFAPRTYHDRDGAAAAFSALPLTHLTHLAERPAASMSAALDLFYTAREAREDLAQGRAALAGLVAGHVKRLERKLALQLEAARETHHADELRHLGELLTAGLYTVPDGAEEALVPDFTQPGAPPVRIPLDPRLPAAATAQRLFAEYRHARRTGEAASREAERSRSELAYLESVVAAVEAARSPADLAEVRAELVDGGYAGGRPRREHGRPGATRPAPVVQPQKPLRLQSSDGLTILVGRNNRQNDYLTLRLAAPDDIWLHVKDAPGAHVVLRVPPRQEAPDAALLEAAQVAAYFSRVRQSSTVGVDYTRRRHVRKPRGAKPGMVIYDHHHTLMVAPALPPAPAGSEPAGSAPAGPTPAGEGPRGGDEA